MDWFLNTYASVELPSDFRLMASDEVPRTGKKPDNAHIVTKALERLMEHEGLDPGRFELKKHKSGKPYGILDGNRIGVSISHCDSLLVCALYPVGETGIDVEPCCRPVHPSLRNRMIHPDEQEQLLDDLCSIRLWTVKEAVLKYLGTGLRLAMNKIKLEMADDHLFQAEIDAQTLMVASFSFRDHWVAAAFHEQHKTAEVHDKT